MNRCETCKWHDSFSWVCFNGDSPYVADFTQNEDVCDEYEHGSDTNDTEWANRTTESDK